MARSQLFSILLLSIIGIAVSQLIPSGLEFTSPVFRVYPYGDCTTTVLRSMAPCFSGTQYGFFNVTTTGVSIRSLVVVPITSLGATFYYLGMANNEIWVISQTGNSFVFVQSAGAPASNWEFAFTDASSYVAFVNKATGAAVVAKYAIADNGTLITPPTVFNVGASGVVNINNVIYREPTAWIAGGTKIATLNLNNGNVTAFDASSVVTSLLTINCGAAGTGSQPNIMYAGSGGEVFVYSTASNSVSTTFASVGQTFSTACGAKGNSYGVFFTAAGRAYQFNFAGAALNPTPAFIIENIAPTSSRSVAVVNPDQTGIYLFPYTTSGPNALPDTIYEFYLLPTFVDFSSVIQATPDDGSYHNIFAAYVVSSTLYIGTSATNDPRIYQVTIPATLTPAPNASSLLFADFSIPSSPTGPNGKTNSIADVGQNAGNGDIIFGNGVAQISVPANSSVAIPPRGPINSFIRGTKSVSPNHGGIANTDAAICLRLVSLDEVSTPAVVTNTTKYNLIRRMPFYPADTAPWFQKTVLKPDGITVTGYQWEVGVTNNQIDASFQYSYLVPPMALVINNTSPTPPSSKRLANQYSPGYVSFVLTEEVFLQNNSLIQLNNITFNVTTRTFRYRFAVNSWTFSSNQNYLRLNVALGLGPDGNGTLSVTQGDNNATGSNSFLKAYVLAADSADWVLILPQNMIQGTNTFVDAPAPCVFDPNTNIISAFFPYSSDPAVPGKSANQTYTLLLEYSYITPPPTPPDNQDGGGPHLLPLWIVLGVLGCIVIVGVIVAIIVIVVLYRLIWRNKTELETRTVFGQTENALDT